MSGPLQTRPCRLSGPTPPFLAAWVVGLFESTIQEIASIVAEPSGYRDEFDHPEDRRQNRAPQINMLPAPAWHAPLTQPARALWLRVSAAAAPHLRTRRTPRTST